MLKHYHFLFAGIIPRQRIVSMRIAQTELYMESYAKPHEYCIKIACRILPCPKRMWKAVESHESRVMEILLRAGQNWQKLPKNILNAPSDTAVDIACGDI